MSTDEKPTVELEKPPAWAVSMAEKMENGFRGLRADVSLVANDVSVVRDRVVILERWKVESEERASKNSQRVQMTSDDNLKQDAAIAKVLTTQDEHSRKLDDLAAKPDTAALVLAKMEAAAKTPTAKKLGAAILPVLLLAISAIGIKLQFAVTKLESKPETVQPAPTVYIQIPADGGVK